MISSSQCNEDIFLNDNFFKNKKNGKYIELGALDGVLYSNTKFFEDYFDWTGILIEPHPYKFSNLQKNRPRSILYNCLVSDSQYPLKYKYFVDTHAAVSGVEESLSNHHYEKYYHNETWKNFPIEVVELEPMTLTNVIKQSGIDHFDLLSLDVEGHEYEVLKSWDFSVKIDVILIEMLGVQPDKDQLCRQLLLSNGYKYNCQFAHNEIFTIY